MSNLTPVTAYADKKGKLHLSESEVHKANNEYEKDEYCRLIANYYNKFHGFDEVIRIGFLSTLSNTTLHSMCIDLKVFN